MSDGIKFLVELDSRTQRMEATINSLKALEDTVGKGNHALKESHGHFSALGSDLFKAEVASDLFKKAYEKSFEAVKEGIRKVGDLINDTIKIAGAERREKMSLTNFLGGPEAADEALHYMTRFGELSEFGDEKAKNFGEELLNAGYRAREFKDALAAVADAASMAPDKIKGAQEALDSLVNMKLKGKLDDRVVRGLRLNSKDLIKGLGDSLGMTPAAVKKGLTDGTIPAAAAFQSVLRALEKKTGKNLGEAGLAVGRGLESKLTHFKELPDMIMKEVADSPGMDKIEHAFDKLLESFDPKGPAGSKLVGGLSSLMESVGDFMDGVDWGNVSNEVLKVAKSLGSWVDPLSKALKLVGGISKGILELPQLGEELGDWMAGVFNPKAKQVTDAVDNQKWVAREKQRIQKSFEDKNLQPFSGLPKGIKLPAPNAAGFSDTEGGMANVKGPAAQAGSQGGTHIEGKAEVHVHLPGGSSASAQEVAHAAKAGTEAGLTKALEKQGLHAGTQSARRRK